MAEAIRGPLLRRLTSTLAAWSAARPVLDALNDAALPDEVAAAVSRDLGRGRGWTSSTSTSGG